MHLCHLWRTEMLAADPEQVHDMHPRSIFLFHPALAVL